MALTGLMSLSVLKLCILVALVIQPVQVNASRGSSFGMRHYIPEASSTSGTCASSVTLHGYKCQELEVKTEDGFILSLQRITEGKNGNQGKHNRPPVIVQHGITVDGMAWLINSPEQNFPLILADNGFDVWLANARGTKFSRRHSSLDCSDSKYWDWSWDELAKYELSAVLEFVYKQTGQKVHYVGHSLGTLVALAALSERKHVDKYKSVALLSPIAYLSHMPTLLGQAAARSLVGEYLTFIGVAEFNPKGETVGQFLKHLCSQPGVDCYDLMTAITGKNCCLNSSTIDRYLQYEPQSTSTKNMVHLAQIVRYNVVAKYDYLKPEENKKHYGEDRPPKYTFSNIPHDIPLFMGHGGRDALSDVKDVQLLLDDLKHHEKGKLTVHFVEDYAHQDFIMAVNAKDKVYNAVIDFFRRHSH